MPSIQVFTQDGNGKGWGRKTLALRVPEKENPERTDEGKPLEGKPLKGRELGWTHTRRIRRIRKQIFLPPQSEDERQALAPC